MVRIARSLSSVTLHLLVVVGGGDQDGIEAIGLLQLDLDIVLTGRGDVLADVVGADGQLPVAAIDEDGEAGCVPGGRSR